MPWASMRSGRRLPPNHRLANIQKRRSALLSRGRGYQRCSTSNCCRKQRFSAINRVFRLNIAAMAHSRSRNTRPSGRSSASRSDSPAICQRQRGRRLFCAPQHLTQLMTFRHSYSAARWPGAGQRIAAFSCWRYASSQSSLSSA
jgi:hypothetical protein